MQRRQKTADRVGRPSRILRGSLVGTRWIALPSVQSGDLGERPAPEAQVTSVRRIEGCLHKDVSPIPPRPSFDALRDLRRVDPDAVLSHPALPVRAREVQCVTLELVVDEAEDPYTLAVESVGLRNELDEGYAVQTALADAVHLIAARAEEQ